MIEFDVRACSQILCDTILYPYVGGEHQYIGSIRRGYVRESGDGEGDGACFFEAEGFKLYVNGRGLND